MPSRTKINKDIPLETGLAIRKPLLIKPARLINRGCACGINKQSLNQYQVQFQIFPSLRSFTFSGQDQSYLYPMQRCDMIPVSINKSYDLPLKKRIMFLRLPRIITIRRGTSIFRTIRPATNIIPTVLAYSVVLDEPQAHSVRSEEPRAHSVISDRRQAHSVVTPATQSAIA